MTEAERVELREYIEARSIPIPHAGCRIWLAAIGSSGYGAAWWRGKRADAHVLAHLAWIGPLPDDRPLSTHTCDTRICCEWTHLVAGTKATNGDDVARRLRGGRKLTAAQARGILAALAEGRSGRSLAREHGVSHAAIQHIASGRSWPYA